MRLEANDDEILWPKLGGIIGATRIHHALLITDQQLQPIGLHRCEMRPARNKADLRACQGKLNAEVAPDCTRTVNTNLHRVPQIMAKTTVTLPLTLRASRSSRCDLRYRDVFLIRSGIEEKKQSATTA